MACHAARRSSLQRSCLLERSLAGDELVEHRAEAEDVRARIDRLSLRCSGDIYTAVPNSALDSARGVRADAVLGQADRAVSRPMDSRALVSGDQEVCGLEVPVQDPVPMCRLECRRDLHRQAYHFLDAERTDRGVPSTYSSTR